MRFPSLFFHHRVMSRELWLSPAEASWTEGKLNNCYVCVLHNDQKPARNSLPHKDRGQVWGGCEAHPGFLAR